MPPLEIAMTPEVQAKVCERARLAGLEVPVSALSDEPPRRRRPAQAADVRHQPTRPAPAGQG
jgi:hypothetical protein